MVGKQIGQFEIIEQVGKGGMASVYRAYQPAMERYVAIKVIHHGLAQDELGRMRFKREAQLVARLEHPHLLPVFNYFPDHEPPYIVMRYLEGGTLKDLLKTRKRLPLDEIAYICGQIASALDYAHRQNIIHRDIKPSNIMIDIDGNVYLADFGIARLMNQMGITHTDDIVGTPYYMSPEQALGYADLSPASDIYALGAVVFELATGQAPYTAENGMAVLVQHIQDPIPSALSLNPKLPEGLDEIFKKVMAKEAEDRYQSAGEFAEVLSSFVTQDKGQFTLSNLEFHTDKKKQGLDFSQSEVIEDSETIDIKIHAGKSKAKIPSVGILVACILLLLGTILIMLMLSQLEKPAIIFASSEDYLSPSPSPNIPMLRTRRDLEARFGPDADFVVIATIATGEVLEITGLTQDGRWYQILLPTGDLAWLPRSSTFVETFGAVDQIQVVNVPVRTATASPTVNPIETDIAFVATLDMQASNNAASLNAQATQMQSNYNAQATQAAATIHALNSENQTTLLNAYASGTASANSFATEQANATTQFLNLQSEFTLTLAANNISTMPPLTLPSPSPSALIYNEQGSLPFLMDFEAGAADLVGSDFDADYWQLGAENGQTILYGLGALTEPFVILGNPEITSPEWLNPINPNLLLSLRVNIVSEEGARLLFRFQEGLGYQVLELTPNKLSLRRSSQADWNPLNSRDTEAILGSYDVTLNMGEWYQLSLWLNGRDIYLYQNMKLIAHVQDNHFPELSTGQIMLQNNNRFSPARFDDILIRYPAASSENFQDGQFPTTWEQSESKAVAIGSDAEGNQYLELNRNASVRPIILASQDIELNCRVYSALGGYSLYLRESEFGGRLHLRMEAGGLKISLQDAVGTNLFSREFNNVYFRERWQDLYVFYMNQELQIRIDGQIIFDEILDIPLASGQVRFAAAYEDHVYLDDCVFSQSAQSKDSEAAFAYALLEQINQRNFHYPTSDLDENFDDIFRTDGWWYEGLNAAGEFVTETETEYSSFLRMSYEGFPTFRLFRDNVGLGIFGAGLDRSRFIDTTDIFVTVDIRMAQNSMGEAWLGIRSTRTFTGNTLNGYRMRLRHDENTEPMLYVDYFSTNGDANYFAGIIPSVNDEIPEWINFTVISFEDRIAFFANERFVVAINHAEVLGGTVALGVGENSTADFDNLIIRDTSPVGE